MESKYPARFVFFVAYIWSLIIRFPAVKPDYINEIYFNIPKKN